MKSFDVFKFVVLPLALVAIAGLGYYLYYNTFYRMDLSRRDQSRSEEVVQSAFFMCQVTERLLHKRAEAIATDVEYIMDMLGKPDFGPGRQNWEVRVAGTDTTQNLNLPPLAIYHRNGERRHLESFVTAVQRRTGGEVTILQTVNERGDQVKVFCTLGSIKGPKQETTLVPIQRRGGQPDRGRDALARDNLVVRPEFLHGRLYLSVYYPLRTPDRDIGALVVRLDDPDLDRLRYNLMQLQLGPSGYVYVLRGTGIHQGSYVISQNGERDGEDLWHSRDAAGRLFIQSLVSRALNIDPRRQRISVPVIFERYPWKNPGDPYPRYKTAALTYFEPWDWVIGAGYYEDEF